MVDQKDQKDKSKINLCRQINYDTLPLLRGTVIDC
jgi:hypothetical protein